MDERTKVKRWAECLREIRRFFDERGFFEVTTTSLVPAGAFESSIDTLKVSFGEGTAELHTSPEMEMKRVLADTHLPIYQLAKAIRDDPPTGVHKREFTMLEFYRPNCDYRTTREDTQEMFSRLTGGALNFEEISMRDLFLRTTGIDIAIANTGEGLRREVEKRSLVTLAGDDAWDDIYFKLLIEKVEPALHPSRPTLIYDYPASQAALGKVNPASGWAERFEIYWQGMELCNGCTELDSIEELHRRYERESRNRAALGKLPHPFPTRLFEAMQKDFPPASGVAVGVDRLFRCLTGIF
jgi:lysyl-tRNA synthetase class 2